MAFMFSSPVWASPHGDVNCDGEMNVVDVQISIILALLSPLSAVLDADGNNTPDDCDALPASGICGAGTLLDLPTGTCEIDAAYFDAEIDVAFAAGVASCDEEPSCDDGIECTDESWDTRAGCTHSPNDSLCVDDPNDPCDAVSCVLDIGCVSSEIPGCVDPPAGVGVTYLFEGEITPYSSLPQGASQSFSWTTSDFITTDTEVSASELTSCSAGYDNGICGGIAFKPSAPGCVSCGSMQISFWDGYVNPNYYFPGNAFTTEGTHETTSVGNQGFLTVIYQE